MGDEQNGQAQTAVDVFQQFQNRTGGGRIQCAGGFVAQQYFGVAGQCTGDRHALFLAAGQVGRVGVVFVRQADQLQQFGHALLISARGVLSSSSGSATLPNTVREESRLKCWKIMPIWRRARVSSLSDSEVRS